MIQHWFQNYYTSFFFCSMLLSALFNLTRQARKYLQREWQTITCLGTTGTSIFSFRSADIPASPLPADPSPPSSSITTVDGEGHDSPLEPGSPTKSDCSIDRGRTRLLIAVKMLFTKPAQSSWSTHTRSPSESSTYNWKYTKRQTLCF